MTQTSVPGNTEQLCPVPVQGQALRAGWCPPPQGQAQLVSITTTALFPVWNWLHVLLWSIGTREGPRDIHQSQGEMSPKCLYLPDTSALLHVATETFKVFARRKPAPTVSASKATFPWTEILLSAKSSLPLNFQEESLLKALNSAVAHLLPPEFTLNEQRC